MNGRSFKWKLYGHGSQIRASLGEIVKFRFDTERGQQLWDVRKVKSGIYLYTLKAGINIKSGKLIIK